MHRKALLAEPLQLQSLNEFVWGGLYIENALGMVSCPLCIFAQILVLLAALGCACVLLPAGPFSNQ